MSNFPYRQGVTAIVVDDKNNFLIVQKQNYGDNQWDFPGGGLEENEDPKFGILRELKEELGYADFEILKESPFIDRFEWPKESQEHGFAIHGKWWGGQEKHQFIIRFLGRKEKITIQNEEIRKIKWVPYSELKEHLIFEGQWDNAKKVLEDAGVI